MPNDSDMRAMLGDGTKMQEMARELLDISQRMADFSKRVLEDDEVSDDPEDRSSKNKAKEMAVMMAKKSRKK